jgi:hypothetical protein
MTLIHATVLSTEKYGDQYRLIIELVPSEFHGPFERLRLKKNPYCDSFPFSLEQVNSELPLEVLDLFAEGRLRHMEAVGRMGKIQLLSSSDKVFEVAKFRYWLRSVRPRLSQRFIRTR